MAKQDSLFREIALQATALFAGIDKEKGSVSIPDDPMLKVDVNHFAELVRQNQTDKQLFFLFFFLQVLFSFSI